MIRAFVVLLVIIALPCFAQGSDSSIPNHGQIKKWWRAEYPDKPDEEMEVYKVKPIRLKGGEKAFLAKVIFFGRGRCCENVALLIRPVKQRAREIDSTFRTFEVYDLDHDGVSEIMAEDDFCGQGTCYGEKTILYFDGWEPIVMHSQSINDNESCCLTASTGPCYSKEVIWTFRQLDNNPSEDLVELIIYLETDEQCQWKWATAVNVYALKDKKFISITPDPYQFNEVKRDELERFFCSFPVDPKHYLPLKINEANMDLNGEVLYSSPRCMGLRVGDEESRRIIGMRLKPNVFRPGPELRMRNKVEVNCSYKNGFLHVNAYKMIEKAPLKSRPKPTKKDCSKYIQLLTKAADEKDMRAKAREYIYCLIQSGFSMEKATTHVTATIETLNALQKTSITPEKLQLLGPVLSGKMDQRDKVGEAGYPLESTSPKDISYHADDQFHPNSKSKSEKIPLNLPAVVADSSEIEITKENLKPGKIVELKNASDHDLMVSVKFPTESLEYTVIVRKKEQTKVPNSKWNRIPLKLHDSVLLVMIADTDQTSLRKLNGKKIDVSVWKGEEHIQSLSIPFSVSKDLLDSTK